MPGNASSRSPLVPAERDLLLALRQHASEGQWFLAYDTARQGIESYPNVPAFKQEAALALINLGAIAEAEKMLLPISPDLGDGGSEETIGLLGRVYKELWRETRHVSDARRCRDMYRGAFAASGGYWSCINVATMTRVLAEDPAAQKREELLAESRRYAELAIQKCADELAHATGDALFWLAATTGEARLLLGDERGAIGDFQRARSLALHRHGQIVSIRRQLTLLSNVGVSVPRDALALFAPSAVVCFSGHMIDAPNRAMARFPPEAEKAVRAAIDRELDALGESIGYASAACGADILFLEAMLEREAEVNIILPFQIDDFIQTSVQFAGERWVRRFRHVLKLAGDRVYSATTEPFLRSEELFQFGNRIVIGLSQLRARSLATRPQLLAVADPTAEPGVNGTAAIIASWAAEPRPRVIDLSEIRRSLPATPGVGHPTGVSTDLRSVGPVQTGTDPIGSSARLHGDAASAHGLSRSIKTFLFADVKGFSALTELQVPLFMFEFLRTLADRLSALPVQPQLVQTWGDGLYVVMADAFSMVEYALALQQAVVGTDWSTKGLPASLTMRIGLHAGPAFEGVDPFTKSRSFFGSHVTRAARIEPITLPGHIYATMQFVALLAAEQAVRPEAPGGWPMSCEYLGQLALAKDSGDMPLYHIRRRFGDKLHSRTRP